MAAEEEEPAQMLAPALALVAVSVSGTGAVAASASVVCYPRLEIAAWKHHR
jgi:hypothetical protein